MWSPTTWLPIDAKTAATHAPVVWRFNTWQIPPVPIKPFPVEAVRSGFVQTVSVTSANKPALFGAPASLRVNALSVVGALRNNIDNPIDRVGSPKPWPPGRG